jgi:hypothetical protein
MKCDIIGCQNESTHQQRLEVAFAYTIEVYRMPPAVFVCEAHKDGVWSGPVDKLVWDMVVDIADRHNLIPLRGASQIVTEPIVEQRSESAGGGDA